MIQVAKLMRLRNWQASVFEQRLQELLRGLLAMKANAVRWLFLARERGSEPFSSRLRLS
jgi:hypothetical protein